MYTASTAKSTKSFYSIGHSNRQQSDFIELLRKNKITVLVDVRTMPRSRANPQFNTDVLSEALNEVGIKYVRYESLAGFRKKRNDIDPDVNGFWENQSFHNYADYALTPEFESGLLDLIDLGKKETVAMMCAEVVWWRCHRRIITDYLLAGGARVYHIIDKSPAKPAVRNKAAKKVRNGGLVYPLQDKI